MDNELRIVQGNTFATAIEIHAVDATGQPIVDWSLQDSTDLRVWYVFAGREVDITTWSIENGKVVILWLANQQRVGAYDIFVDGVFNGGQWRNAMQYQFRIVRFNHEANIPSNVIILDGIYQLSAEMAIITRMFDNRGTPSDTTPKMDGEAEVGTEERYARGDHRHPSDTNKQDVIADLEAIRSGAEAGATAYQKPANGIPSTDLASGVQTSLGKADTAVQPAAIADMATETYVDGAVFDEETRAKGVENALQDAIDTKQDTISDLSTIRSGAAAGATAYQKPSTGIPKTDLASAVQTSLGKADTALQSSNIVNSLNSSATDKPLAANQGRILNEEISQLAQQVIYDVTANNASAEFASLSTLLSSENLPTLIPTAVRCGGMSIRFVQSSDNKYVQFRCTTQTFSTNPDDWENVTDIKNGLEKQITTLYESGKGNFNISNFKHGKIFNGVFDSSTKYRVCTPIGITIPYATKVKAATGFRFFYYEYSDETWQSVGGWKTEETFNGGELVKICIARATEDTSEIADITEYVSSLTFTTFISESSKSLDISRQNLKSSQKLYGTGKGIPPFEFARGALFSGNLEESVLYRVSQVSFETAERDYYLTAKSGYKFSIFYYNGDSIVDTGWKYAYTINNGLVFKIQVARETEDTSEVADINEYVSALTMTTLLSDLSEAVFSDVVPNYFRETGRLQTGTAWQRVQAFSNLNLDKDTTYLFKVKYDSALTSTAYAYLMKSDNTQYEVYGIGASGTTEYELLITPLENLEDAYINVASGQTNVAADLEISNLRTIHSTVDMNYQSISRKNLPLQTIAVGHTGANSGIYPLNSIENAMYNVLNNGFKAIEVDVKMTSDYVPVIAHEQTVTYDGQTYQINEITFAQATEFGLKPFEPYLVCSKRYGFSLWVDSPFSQSDYKNQCDALVAMMHKYGSTQHIKITVNYALIPAMRYLTTIDNTIGIGLIYFSRGYMKESDVIGLKNLTNGEVCLEFELDNAITTQDTDYINYWRSKGFSFCMFTIYNSNNPIERTKEWADLVDYIVTEYNQTPELLMEYDFPS